MPTMRSRFTFVRLVVAAVAIAVYWWSVEGTEFNIVELMRGLPALGGLLWKMVPPDLEFSARLWRPLLETLQIGILATIIGSLLSIPVGFFAARNMSPAFLYHPVRLLLNAIRGISEVIWALFFVVAVGLGPFAGVLALVTFSIGILGKLLGEAVEAVDPGSMEAMRAAGASRWKVFLYGACPQVLPLYLSYTLYYWDHNTRAATILGFIGAGGIGWELFFAIIRFEFGQAATAIILIVLMITAIDWFCLFLRKKII